MSFLSNRYARVLTVFLILQFFAFYALASRPERTPMVGPLANFPAASRRLDRAARFSHRAGYPGCLAADDTLDRLYVRYAREPQRGFLFVAFFKTQRYGQSPHSPKNCLPGAGWEPVAGMSAAPR